MTDTMNDQHNDSGSDPELLRRWRLILGRYAGQPNSAAMNPHDQQIDHALDYLYGREYQGRGLLRTPGSGGSLDPNAIRAVDWLQRTRTLFPQDVFERIQQHAVEKYQLAELLQDPDVLRSLEPNQALARTLLGMRGRMSAQMRDAVQDVIRQVVEEITRRLRPQFVNALVGRATGFAVRTCPARRTSTGAPPSPPTCSTTTWPAAGC